MAKAKKTAKKATKKAAPKKATVKAAAKKTTAKAAAPKKTSAKAAAPKKAGSKKAAGNSGFMKAMNISPELQKIVGSASLPRTEVTKKVWQYIKKHNLQDPKNRRNINANDDLKTVLGKAVVGMFEMTKLLSKHLS